LQGLFISLIALQDPSFSHQYLAPLPSTQPDKRPNEALSTKPKNPGHTKPPSILSTYFYPYSLNAFTKNIAPYRHDECHWLVQISPPPDTTRQGFD
jgi:hypothetical protein